MSPLNCLGHNFLMVILSILVLLLGFVEFHPKHTPISIRLKGALHRFLDLFPLWNHALQISATITVAKVLSSSLVLWCKIIMVCLSSPYMPWPGKCVQTKIMHSYGTLSLFTFFWDCSHVLHLIFYLKIVCFTYFAQFYNWRGYSVTNYSIIAICKSLHWIFFNVLSN